MAQVWIVRAGPDDAYEKPGFAHGIVALGWRRVGDLSGARTQTAIRQRVDTAYWDVSVRSRLDYVAQLFAFRCAVSPDDHVILLRGNAPDLAVGVVTGDYAFREDLPGCHTRAVRWVRTDVTRAEVGADLLAAPALTKIYRVQRPDATARLAALLSGASTAEAQLAVSVPSSQLPAFANLQRNLEYARNLATAGLHLQRLKVGAFEVEDVYRAAWVQAVAALDQWVRQEIRERILARVNGSSVDAAQRLVACGVAKSVAQDVTDGKLTAGAAVDQHFAGALTKTTFQKAPIIAAGFAKVADVDGLWDHVAQSFTERGAEAHAWTATTVSDRLNEIVVRRNKIAHEYDEDPGNPPHKRSINATDATQTVEWIGRLAQAVMDVLG
jgi:hypothetical protein